jgi:outer membrane scaffolding protein for murein synthesis (MipA/OmpV family)
MTQTSLFHPQLAIWLGGLGCAACLPLAAIAEITNNSMVGPGLRSRPAYDGATTQRQELVPVIRYFGQPWFARSTQGVLEAGVRTELLPELHAGVQLAYEPGRQASEADFLQSHHVADIARGASYGAQLEWDHQFGPMPVTLLARARKHSDSALGAQADLRLSAGVFQSGRLAAGVFTQATWADAASTASFYGINPGSAAVTGLPVFAPRRGWLFGSVGLLGSLELSPKWVIVGSLEARRLRGDAAHSPLVQRASNHYVSTGLAYRF